MYCKSCGCKLRSESKFCSNCGEVVEKDTDKVKSTREEKVKKKKEVIDGEVISDNDKNNKNNNDNTIYCRNCGQEIPINSDICPICRYHLVNKSTETSTVEVIMICLFSFFIPIVGLILWAIFKDEDRPKAKKALIAAITGILIALLLVFLIFMFLIIVFS